MARILIVEDDESMRGLIRQRLSDSFDVTDTGDATEALGLALATKPDCILVDLMMPRFSGLELCQTFTSVSNTQTIPIFVITGQSADEHREFCLNLGARDFFQKPLDFEKLKSSIQRAVNTPQTEQRREHRIRLKVIVKLFGTSVSGKRFDLLTSTEDVSANGFLCKCSVDLEPGAIVEVFLLSRSSEVLVGRASMRHVQWPGTPWQNCGFGFIEKNASWVL
jgi:DNA-binding response OmpR family regulator